MRFDLNPDERREGAVQFAGGDWMRDLVNEAAIREDLDGLIQFQRRSVEGDPSLVRHEKARAHMWELAPSMLISVSEVIYKMIVIVWIGKK